MQALVICARGVAVMEVCKHLLSPLPRRLGTCVAHSGWGARLLVLLYAGLAAKTRFAIRGLPKAARALGAGQIAAVIRCRICFFFVITTWKPKREDRSLAIGFLPLFVFSAC